jgi:phage gpG-like protein
VIEFFVLEQSKVGVTQYLERVTEGLVRNVAVRMRDQMRQLSNYVKEQKLSGQVLNRRTGNLSRGVNSYVTEDASAVEGKVGVSNLVPYAAFHEYGFSGTEQVREYARRTRSGKIATVRAHSREVNYPAHSFLRTALAEKKAEIINALARNITEGLEPKK